MEWTCLKKSLLFLLFLNSRDDPPEIGMIILKVGSAAGSVFWVVWVSCLSGGPGGGGGRSSWIVWVVAWGGSLGWFGCGGCQLIG